MTGTFLIRFILGSDVFFSRFRKTFLRPREGPETDFGMLLDALAFCVFSVF